MDCAVHPEIEARCPCAVCFKNLCDACATYDLEIRGAHASCCERCGRDKEDVGNALSSGLLALTGVGYLAALALGIIVFKARPFVGGLAAIVAIGLGRTMQLLVKTPTVTRRMPSAAPGVDATPPPL